jgi:hypothetical protein
MIAAPDPVKLAAALKKAGPADLAPKVSPSDYPGSYLWNRGNLSPAEVHTGRLVKSHFSPGLPKIIPPTIKG